MCDTAQVDRRIHNDGQHVMFNKSEQAKNPDSYDLYWNGMAIVKSFIKILIGTGIHLHKHCKTKRINSRTN